MPFAALAYLGAKCALGTGVLVGLLKVKSALFEYMLPLMPTFGG